MTYRTQRWIWNSSPIDLSGEWRVPTDGWVRGDAVLISADIFSANWTSIKIDNYGEGTDPLAYEPLAWVHERSTYVVIDMNIPDVDDPYPTYRARPDFVPVFDHLTVMPEISTGPVCIDGAKGSAIEIYNSQNSLVATLTPTNGSALWEGIRFDANPPGTYTIVSGGESAQVELIR